MSSAKYQNVKKNWHKSSKEQNIKIGVQTGESEDGDNE